MIIEHLRQKISLVQVFVQSMWHTKMSLIVTDFCYHTFTHLAIELLHKFFNIAILCGVINHKCTLIKKRKKKKKKRKPHIREWIIIISSFWREGDICLDCLLLALYKSWNNKGFFFMDIISYHRWKESYTFDSYCLLHRALL